MPILTILLPTSNRGRVLKHSLPDLKEQLQGLLTDGTCQLVISDNCSQDDTLEVCKSLFCGFPSVTIVRQAQFMDVESHHRHCLSYANGDFVLYLGDDDQLNGAGLRTLCGLLRDYCGPLLAVYIRGIPEADEFLRRNPPAEAPAIRRLGLADPTLGELLPSLGFLLANVFSREFLEARRDAWLASSGLAYARLLLAYRQVRDSGGVDFAGVVVGHGNRYQYLLAGSGDYSQSYRYHLQVLSINRFKVWLAAGRLGCRALDRRLASYVFASLFGAVDRPELSLAACGQILHALIPGAGRLAGHPVHCTKLVALAVARLLRLRRG